MEPPWFAAVLLENVTVPVLFVMSQFPKTWIAPPLVLELFPEKETFILLEKEILGDDEDSVTLSAAGAPAPPPPEPCPPLPVEPLSPPEEEPS